jgi:hypothetical protein
MSDQSALGWTGCSAVERYPQRVSCVWIFRGTRVPLAVVTRVRILFGYATTVPLRRSLKPAKTDPAQDPNPFAATTGQGVISRAYRCH